LGDFDDRISSGWLNWQQVKEQTIAICQQAINLDNKQWKGRFVRHFTDDILAEFSSREVH
jgi:hypothetical protein